MAGIASITAEEAAGKANVVGHVLAATPRSLGKAVDSDPLSMEWFRSRWKPSRCDVVMVEKVARELAVTFLSPISGEPKHIYESGDDSLKNVGDDGAHSSKNRWWCSLDCVWWRHSSSLRHACLEVEADLRRGGLVGLDDLAMSLEVHRQERVPIAVSMPLLIYCCRRLLLN
jgi:hypothetical protein